MHWRCLYLSFYVLWDPLVLSPSLSVWLRTAIADTAFSPHPTLKLIHGFSVLSLFTLLHFLLSRAFHSLNPPPAEASYLFFWVLLNFLLFFQSEGEGKWMKGRLWSWISAWFFEGCCYYFFSVSVFFIFNCCFFSGFCLFWHDLWVLSVGSLWICFIVWENGAGFCEFCVEGKEGFWLFFFFPVL